MLKTTAVVDPRWRPADEATSSDTANADQLKFRINFNPIFSQFLSNFKSGSYPTNFELFQLGIIQ